MEDLIRLILQSYTINYPVLQHWGYDCPKPIALIFDCGMNMQTFIKGLGLAPQIFDISSSNDKIRRDLHDANSDGAFLIIRSEDMKHFSSKMQSKIDLITSAAQLHCAGDMKTRCACFFCIEEFAPPEFSADTFTIGILPSCEYGDQAENFLQLIPEPQQFELIQDKLRNCPNLDPSTKWLYAACAFMYPKLAEMGRCSLYDKLLAEIPKLVEADEAYRERDTVIDLAVDHMCDLAMQGKFDDAWDLSAGPIDGYGNAEWIDNQLFYRSQYLYMSEKRFRELFGPILKAVAIDLLKERLAADGIIVGDGNRFTAKVFIRFRSEPPIRVRMVRFDISRIISGDGNNLADFIRYSGGSD